MIIWWSLMNGVVFKIKLLWFYEPVCLCSFLGLNSLEIDYINAFLFSYIQSIHKNISQKALKSA